MSEFKFPGLLIRVSHLILIQVFFIFSALALVLFYPQRDEIDSFDKSQLDQTVQAVTANMAGYLKSESDSPELASNTILNIKELIAGNSNISGFELVHLTSAPIVTGKIVLRNYKDNEYTFTDTSSFSYSTLVEYLYNENKPYIASFSPDGQSLDYLINPDIFDYRYTAVLKVPLELATKAGGFKSELLLLLFLISTLISLLIINLISKGIKEPLNDLINAFQETADGKEPILAEENGDRDIRRLARAFNVMSARLTNKQQELSESNLHLMKANQSLLESESILTSLVDYSPDAILVTDLDDQVIIYNHAAARDFGYRQDNLTGKNITNLFSIAVSGIESEGSNDNLNQREVICRRRDGSKFPALLVRTPLGLEGDKPMAMLYFIKNISESENYREMVLKLDRIASRGKMARDIAHEINNYLAILQGNVELLPIIIGKNDPQKIEERLALLRDSINNISTFTEGLTNFGDENSDFEREDVNQLIENLLAFLKPQNKFDNIFVGTNLSEKLPLVVIDSSQIQLLIANLLNNSAEVLAEMKGKRWIVVSTDIDETESSFLIKIADSGPGIEEELLNGLFVKRFSTKKDANGLGLITCKNIVDNHGGEISYHSTGESNAIFIVKLPISESRRDYRVIENSLEETSTVSSVSN
jgi:two-component system sensor kinase FixL